MKAFKLIFILFYSANFVHCDPNPDPKPQFFYGALGALFGVPARKPTQQPVQQFYDQEYYRTPTTYQIQTRAPVRYVQSTLPPRTIPRTITTRPTTNTPITTTTTTKAPIRRVYVTTPKPTFASTISPVINDKNVCGVAGLARRSLIYNGKDTDYYGAWPWTVAFYFKEGSASIRFICGGTLISKKIVISAAHCFYDGKSGSVTTASSVQISMGRYNLQDFTEDHAKYYNARNIILNPEYDCYNEATGHDADIALVESHRPIEYTTYIRPACIWINDNIVTGVPATIIGWGLTENDELSSVLKEADVKIYDRESCSREPGFEHILTRRKICAAGKNTAPCKGDSGGGLYIYTKGRWYLRGIVSETLASLGTMKRCGLTKYATYTDIPKFYDWIIRNL